MKNKNKNSYHHGDLRAELVKTARSLVEQHGPEGVSLRGVATAAGVSRAAPYHHFKDKQSLLAAVAASGFRELAKNMLSKVDKSCSARERLDQLGFGYFEYGMQHAELFRLMQGSSFQEIGKDPELDSARTQSAQPLVDMVSECMPGASREEVMDGCSAAWSTVHGMTVLSIDQRLQTLVKTDDLQKVAKSITRFLSLDTG